MPVVQCGDDLGPYVPTYHAIRQREDVQGVRPFLPAEERSRQRGTNLLATYKCSEKQTSMLADVK